MLQCISLDFISLHRHNTCIHTYVRTYIHTHIHTYVRTYLHTHPPTPPHPTYLPACLPACLLWHRQAIFESKGDKLSSSAESRIRTQGVSETQSPADWMPADKPTELSRIKLKNLNSTARPYDQQAFSPPDPTAIWHSHLALAIYIFVVVNFDALAQASDFRIERRQVVFLCWEQDSNPGGLWNPISSRLKSPTTELLMQCKIVYVVLC